MSEFKYGCPVCGQHIRCDSSQAGYTMICPTCFQKIVVPNAPASQDQKLILTGTLATDRNPGKSDDRQAGAKPSAGNFPGRIVVALIVLFIGGMVAFVYHGTIFKWYFHAPAVNTNTNELKSALIAPEANDTNWILNLAEVSLPNTPAVGRIHGENFIVKYASFTNGSLVLHANAHEPVTFGVTVNFNGAQAATLANKDLNIIADTNKSALVTLYWLNSTNAVATVAYDRNYAMRLKFDALTNNDLPGSIYLCTPDPQKSYLKGTFLAKVAPPKPKS